MKIYIRSMQENPQQHRVTNKIFVVYNASVNIHINTANNVRLQPTPIEENALSVISENLTNIRK